MNELSIQILSVPHREELIAEIKCGDYVIAEINQDCGDLQIEVFSYDDIQIMFPLDMFIIKLKEAKKQLLEI